MTSFPNATLSTIERFKEVRDLYPRLEYRYPVFEAGLGLHTLNSITQDVRARMAPEGLDGDAATRFALYSNATAVRIVESVGRLFSLAPAYMLLQADANEATTPLLKSMLAQLPGTVLTRFRLNRTFAGGHQAMHYELFSLTDPITLTEHVTGVALHYSNHEFVGGMRVTNQAIHLDPEGDRRELSFVEHYYLSSAVPNPKDVDFQMVADHVHELLGDEIELDKWQDRHAGVVHHPVGLPDLAVATTTGRFDASRRNPAN